MTSESMDFMGVSDGEAVLYVQINGQIQSCFGLVASLKL